MAVLAPLHSHHHHNASEDWYRPYKYVGGLATPVSTTSQTSVKSFSRHHSVERDFHSESSPRGPLDHTNMPPAQSPRHAQSYFPIMPPAGTAAVSAAAAAATTMTTTASTTSITRPSLPSIRSLLAEPLAIHSSGPAVPRTTQTVQYSPRLAGHDDGHIPKRSCPSYGWERQSVHASPTSVYPSAPSGDYSMRRDSATQATFEAASHRSPKDVHSHQRLGSAFLPATKTPAGPMLPSSSPVRSAPPVDGTALSRLSTRKRSFENFAGPSSHEAPRYLPPTGPATPRAQAPVQTGYAYPQPVYSYPASGPRGSAMISAPNYSTPLSRPTAEAPLPMHAPPGRAEYEYSLAKSRKRSNLPKESTDIMKRWFEDHLDNPYPSEEEKKYFAAKAGINTTQVSNWFINHRRRCPELKEQRDKRPQASRPMIMTNAVGPPPPRP